MTRLLTKKVPYTFNHAGYYYFSRRVPTDLKNPFVGMYFDKSAGVSKRLPIPIEDIRKVQHLCKTRDDDLRWLVALVSDTGMRLAEGAGLLKSDIILDAEIQHISLKPHPWRPLKTSCSQQIYPL